VTNFVSI